MKKTLLAIVAALALILGASVATSNGDPARANPAEIIVDNSTATFTGTWTASTFEPNFYGSNYHTKPKGTGTATATWVPSVTNADTYGVYYRLPDGYSDRATDAPVVVHDSQGDVTYKLNESPIPGGTWKFLGNHVFASGTSGYIRMSDNANGILIADAFKLGSPGPADYKIHPELTNQTIAGIGVEIQSDSIGSGNNGLPADHTVSVPNDLVPAEQQRFYTEMLSGFRYLRVAEGLYIRGISADRKNIVERFPGQMEQLADLIAKSGIEGANVEYWSPAPYWKSNNSLVDGSLKTFTDPAQNKAFLEEFGDAVVQDLKYLNDHGVPVKMWSLQNEPGATGTGYSGVWYSNQGYYDAFKIVAAKVKAYDPSIIIHGDSWHGQSSQGVGSALISADPDALKNLDAWSWHLNDGNSDSAFDSASLNANTAGKFVFNSEWEFLDNTTSKVKMVQTAQSIMNWMTFENSPTWFWLHALKPTTNAESAGYGLGLWTPTTSSTTNGIAPGYWDYIRTNWNGVAPFVKYMPHDSVRLTVDERIAKKDNRIMAWTSPAGKLGFALTNRSATPYRFTIDLGSVQTIEGHKYDETTTDGALPSLTGQTVLITVPAYSIQLWSQAD